MDVCNGKTHHSNVNADGIQSAITCSKLTIETLDQGVKYFKLTIKTPERRQTSWTYFTSCSSVSIVNFEQVNSGWEGYLGLCQTSFMELLAKMNNS